MHIEIVRNTERFATLEQEWNSLLSESGESNIFLTFDWLFTWWKNKKPGKSLFIIIAKENQKTIGIVPLMLVNRFGFRQLRFIGAGMADYEDLILCGTKAQRECIIGEITKILLRTKGWDILKLQCLREDSSGNICLQEISRKEARLGINFERHKDGAPYLETAQGWNKYYAGLAKKFLADTKRQRSRLFKENNLYLAEKVTAKEELGDLLNKLIELHIARRKFQKTKSILEDKAVRCFLKEVSYKLFEKDILDFSVVRHNGSIAAMHLGFKYLNRFYYYMPVFNEKFQAYSIGRLLLFDLIQQSFNSGIREFDLMLGEEAYKYDWNPKIEPLYSVSIYPKTIPGIAANQCFNRLNVRIKRIIGKKW